MCHTGDGDLFQGGGSHSCPFWRIGAGASHAAARLWPPAGTDEAKVFGYQIIADENDEVLGESSRLLIGATELGLQEIVTKARSLGGVTIASHVDRPAFGIIGKLGFVPDDLRIDGVEISYRIPLETACDSIPGIKDFPCVTSSDAHCPDDIGRAWTSFLLAAPTVEEIRLVLKGEKGRKVGI